MGCVSGNNRCPPPRGVALTAASGCHQSIRRSHQTDACRYTFPTHPFRPYTRSLRRMEKPSKIFPVGKINLSHKINGRGRVDSIYNFISSRHRESITSMYVLYVRMCDLNFHGDAFTGGAGVPKSRSERVGTKLFVIGAYKSTLSSII